MTEPGGRGSVEAAKRLCSARLKRKLGASGLAMEFLCSFNLPLEIGWFLEWQ